MTYHADYWMLAGTTAPVVALAAVVTIVPMMNRIDPTIWRRQGNRSDSGQSDLDERYLHGRDLVVNVIGALSALFNVFLQIRVALDALTSLATGHDFLPVNDATDLLTAGFFLLLATLLVRLVTLPVKRADESAADDADAETAET